ncbi:signal transduction protein [Variovorax sp. KBW07]|uniref:HDOD domain-containing protein n=1 Tax=Variovorax sp. KBW07 TaxID=2153358 RepID=UPI000F58AF67|nr:HDOD domain-containing protein [Variovorax sp. KBW07]RQO52897.1 signal transduction protein [Variovorax sp. KBW07]
MTLDELFANDESLPTVPKVVADLMQMLRDDDVPFAAIAHRIELDQVLAAKVLQMVNSPFFGLRRKISSIQGAILMLGLSAIRSFVVSSGLSGAFRKVEGVNLPSFWAHSLRVASVSRYLASKTLRVDPNLAFTAGSMHGIGHLLMAQAMPERMAALNAVHPFEALGRAQLELVEFGYHYGDVSASLAQRWDFASDLVGALASFVNPAKAERVDPLGSVLHLAVWRVALERQGVDLSSIGGFWPSQSAMAIGITEDIVQEMPAPRELAADLESMIA